MKTSPKIRYLLLARFSIMACLLVLSTLSATAQGIIGNQKDNSHTHMSVTTDVVTQIREQVAVTTTTQLFRPNRSAISKKNLHMLYGYALPAGAAVTSMRWKIADTWFVASITGADTVDGSADGDGDGAPSGALSTFARYFGSNPFTFKFLEPLAVDGEITVELTYIQLLEFEDGKISYSYERNPFFYLREPKFNSWTIDVKSESNILFLESNPTLTPQPQSTPTHLVHSAVYVSTSRQPLTLSYGIDYKGVRLNVMSNKPTDEDGYAVMTAVPGGNLPANYVLKKRFLFILDNSGSMVNEKIEHAKSAARYCIDRLNPGDKFNVMSFSSWLQYLNPTFSGVTTLSLLQAHNFIDTLTIGGGTDIMLALRSALSSMPEDDYVNVIVFITDGQAPVNPEELRTLNIGKARMFAFGVGPDVKPQILKQASDALNGELELVTSFANIESKVASVYDRVRFPIVRNPSVRFAPDVVYDVLPKELSDMYSGEQITLTGRYTTPGEVRMVIDGLNNLKKGALWFTGVLLGHADSNTFVPTLWAHRKITVLTKEYDATSTGEKKDSLKNEITKLGQRFGIVTRFTEFVDTGSPDDDDDDDGGGAGDVTSVEFEPEVEHISKLLTIAPNPVQRFATITFDARSFDRRTMKLEIVDILGRTVAVLFDGANAPERFEFTWEAVDRYGQPLPAGNYILLVTTGNQQSSVNVSIAR